MLEQLKRVLAGLRAKLSARTEKAYHDRDAPGATANDEAYASGEAHAYTKAESDVRDAERDEGR